MARLAPTVEAAPPGRRFGRLDGLDLARALAFAGMLFAHFAFSLVHADDPGWLQVVDAVRRRPRRRRSSACCWVWAPGCWWPAAPPTACSSCGERSSRPSDLLIWPFVGVVYLILPHYGLLLAIVPILRRIPTAWLLPAALTAFLVPSDRHGGDGRARPAARPNPTPTTDYTDLAELGRVLAWTGGYPLVGWVGFVLVGLWLSRLRLGERRVQVVLLVAGSAVSLAQPLFRWAFEALGGLPVPTADQPGPAGGWSAFFDGSAHSNRFAWYVLGSATAVAVIGGCLLLVGSVPGRWKVPLVRLGQLALTVYLIHLFIGERVGLAVDRRRPKPSLTTQVLVLTLVFCGLMAFATAWRLRFRRGPVEGTLRAISR